MHSPSDSTSSSHATRHCDPISKDMKENGKPEYEGRNGCCRLRDFCSMVDEVDLEWDEGERDVDPFDI